MGRLVDIKTTLKPLFIKRFEVNKKQIFSSEKIRYPGNCIDDFASPKMVIRLYCNFSKFF